MNSINIDNEYLQKLSKNKDNISLPKENKLSKTQTENIINAIQNKYNLLNKNDALCMLAMVCQKGATSPSYDGKAVFMLKTSVGEIIEFKISEIRQIFIEEKCKGGLRKFARTYATEFFKISKSLNIEGNLNKKIKRLNPNLELEDDAAYWLSDFQAYNEDAPKKLRNLIIKSFPKRNKNN